MFTLFPFFHTKVAEYSTQALLMMFQFTFIEATAGKVAHTARQLIALQNNASPWLGCGSEVSSGRYPKAPARTGRKQRRRTCDQSIDTSSCRNAPNSRCIYQSWQRNMKRMVTCCITPAPPHPSEVGKKVGPLI